MSGNIQHKLLNLEIPPPAGNWETIASRLDAEYDATELKISSRIENASLTPPAFAWEAISAEINEPVQQKAKVIPFNWKRLAAAAVATGLFFTMGWYYFRGQRSTDSIGDVVKPDSNKTQNKPSSVPEQASIVDVSGTIASLLGNIPHAAIVDNIPRLYSNTDNYRSVNLVSYDEPQDMGTDLISKNDVRPVDLIEKKSVSAPLIRDNSGNVILNVDLLKSNSDNYISVTGPNGEQTKVSSKLLNMLIYMNDASSEQEDYIDFLLGRRNSWKTRFNEWREKILQQASFAPSNATFFDVLELKELLKEN